MCRLMMMAKKITMNVSSPAKALRWPRPRSTMMVMMKTNGLHLVKTWRYPRVKIVAQIIPLDHNLVGEVDYCHFPGSNTMEPVYIMKLDMSYKNTHIFFIHLSWSVQNHVYCLCYERPSVLRDLNYCGCFIQVSLYINVSHDFSCFRFHISVIFHTQEKKETIY